MSLARRGSANPPTAGLREVRVWSVMFATKLHSLLKNYADLPRPGRRAKAPHPASRGRGWSLNRKCVLEVQLCGVFDTSLVFAIPLCRTPARTASPLAHLLWQSSDPHHRPWANHPRTSPLPKYREPTSSPQVAGADLTPLVHHHVAPSKTPGARAARTYYSPAGLQLRRVHLQSR